MSKFFKILTVMVAVMVLTVAFSETSEAQLLRGRRGCGLFQGRLLQRRACPSPSCLPVQECCPTVCDPCREVCLTCGECFQYYQDGQWHIYANCDSGCDCVVNHQSPPHPGGLNEALTCAEATGGLYPVPLTDGPTIYLGLKDPQTAKTSTYYIHFKDSNNRPQTYKVVVQYTGKPSQSWIIMSNSRVVLP